MGIAIILNNKIDRRNEQLSVKSLDAVGDSQILPNT